MNNFVEQVDLPLSQPKIEVVTQDITVQVQQKCIRLYDIEEKITDFFFAC